MKTNAGRRIDPIRRAFVPVLIGSLVALGSGVALGHSTPNGQELYWNADLSTPTGRYFGANASIVIYQGSIAYVPGPICSSFQDGQNDFLYPAANVYIVESGSVQPYGALEDVSGTPNTVIAWASSGLFIDEPIGNTGGKFPPQFEDVVGELDEAMPALVGEGTYDVVYDECQDGKYQPTIDALFEGVIKVDFGYSVPGFPSVQLQNEKLLALAMRKATTKLSEILEKKFEAGYAAAAVANPWVAFIQGLGTKTMLADPGAVTLQLYGHLADRYNGIYADPPDPAFNQPTLLEAAAAPPARSSDATRDALADAVLAVDTEARLAEALLHAMERYQGAQEAGDGKWALAQAKEMTRYAAELKAWLGTAEAALDDVAAAVAADPADLEAGAARLAGLAADLQAGDDEAFLQAARNAGLDDAAIQVARSDLLAADWTTWARGDVAAAVAELAAANDAFAAALPGFEEAMASAIGILESEPGVQEPFPIADAGGPYTGVVGVPVALDGSASLGGRLPIAGYEIHTWEWDLDGDGIFDDATGSTPSVTFARPYHGLVGLRVTNGLNEFGRHVAYARADIGTSNRAPIIDTTAPSGSPTVSVGSGQLFSVVASDPDGDPLTLLWRVDGTPVGSASSHTWTPSAPGVHSIEVVATDDEGAAVTHAWVAMALEGDADGDGWNANADCDDADARRNQGNPEVVGNELDDDCDSATPDTGSPPVAAFGVTPAAPEPGQAASFSDRSTDPNDDIVAWAWDFGDGATSTIAAPVHTYATRGSFEASLEVTDAQGRTDSATVTVRVSAPPSAAFTFTPASPAVGGEVEFHDSSADDGSISSRTWDFGDGVTATSPDPVHVYDAPGTYDVTLEVTDDDGLTDSVVQQVSVVSADPATAPTAAFASRSSFNLASRALGAAIAASSGYCCGGHEAFQMLDETPTEPPWATTSAASTHYATVELAGGATLPINRVQVQPRTNASWASQRVKDFTIEVSANGTTFTPVLTAQTTNSADLQTFTLPAGTTARFVRYRPTTNWGSSTNISTARLTVLTHRIGPRVVSFDNFSTNAVSYRWDFGDGSPVSTAASPTHAFPAAGIYTVALTARAADGRWQTTASSYQVVGPVAGMAQDPATPEAGEPMVFTSTSTDALGGISSWSWNFGDGTTSPNPNEVHTFASAGTYEVSLTVADVHGLSDTTTRVVTVGTSGEAAPRALFRPDSVGENSALLSDGAAVATYSSHLSATYPATQIIDGNATNGRWETAATDTTRFVVIDLAGGERQFDRVRIQPIAGNTGVRDFAVDVSADGTSFTTVLEATARNVAALQEFVFDQPASAHYVRLRLLGNQAGSGNNTAVAAFEVVSGGGTNLALLEGGATIVAHSSTYSNAGAPTWLLDGSIDPGTWWATYSGQPLGWVKIDLPGTAPRQIDRVRLMPKVNGLEAVKDFEVAVSTTGTADSDYTTVLRATAANALTLQEFVLSRPMLATSVMYRIRSNYGSTTVTSTVAFKALSGQVGGGTVRFRNLSRSATTYHWDFGDGTSSTEASPVHTYEADGTYRVTLTASGPGGTASYSLDQVVGSAQFDWAPDEPGAGDGTAFRDTSPFLAEHTTRTWLFGDGSTSDATAPVKTYSTSGDYRVVMHGTSPEGVTGIAAATVTVVPVTELRTLFRPSGSANVASSEAGATVVSYTSQFDGNHGPANMLDRNAVSTAYPWATASGTKTGSVIVQLARGGTDGPYLVDAIQVMPRPNYAPQRVKRFEVAVSTSGTAAGDFTTVLTATAADSGNLQTFALPKPVLARYLRYTVLDNRGDSCCTSTQQLKALTGQVGGPTVTFQNLSLNALAYQWDFGDGTGSTEMNPTHTFPAPGLYTVTLTATDASGATQAFSARQRVLTLPDPSFTRSISNPNEAQSVTFTSTTPATADGPIVDRSWTWGDGTAPTSGSPATHAFADDGSYTVRLTVTDAWEQAAFIEQQVTVANVAPAVDAGKDWQWREEGRLRFAPTISDVGTTDTWTCLWDYGDGTSAAGCTFDHTYPDLGDYDTTLTVTDSDGGVSVDTMHVKTIAKTSAGGGGGGGGGSTGSGEVVASTDQTYTYDADFERGTLLNVNHSDTSDALELNRTTSPFPFIWIAASQRGTALRIDVNTGAIVGEYRTAPENRSKNPSRTTVDQYGNVWVTNRDEAESRTIDGETTQWGSVARIGLIIGGERVDSSGVPSATGEYLKPPFQYSTCTDRNGDGLIRTSRGRGNILGWPNTSGVDHDGGVETALDECIGIYTRVHGINTRTVAVDANNDVWVGGANQVHEKLDGVTGQRILGTKFTKSCGGYGGLIDGNGVLWSARYGNGLLRYDTTTATGSCLGNTKGDYGLGIDPVTGNLWQSYLNGNTVVKISPAGVELGRYPHGSERAQGVAVDAVGNVWVTSSVDVGTTLGRVRTDGTFVGSVNLQPGFGVPNGHGPTGVAIDAAGRPWVANLNSNNAQRIDPDIGHLGAGGRPIGYVDLTVDLGAGAGPYNYSDMTGFVAIGSASPQGFWSIVQDGGIADVPWGSISWNGETPAGTSIEVEARAANSQVDLAAAVFVTVGNGTAVDLRGRYIEVRATLRTTDISMSPRLDDIRITANVGSAPVADAGGPYSADEGTPVPLDGTGSSDADGDTLAYAWDLDGDSEFDDSTEASPSLLSGDGPATLTVGLRVTDTSGATSSDTATVSVTNVAPAATIGVDPAAPVAEGGTFTVSLTGPSDPSAADTAAGFEHAFDCGLGDGYGAWGTETSAACTAGDDGTLTVRAKIRDKDGGERAYEAEVSVTNSPPTGTFGATSPIDEGSSSTLAWTDATDPSAADAALLRYAFACDGLLASLTGSWVLASATASHSCTFDDNGEHGVAGRVLDPDNASTTAGALVTVANVAPSATLVAPAAPVAEGGTFTVSLTGPSDPSAADTAAGFEHAFDCGLGDGYGAWGTETSAACTAGDDGTLTVRAKIRDKDGGERAYEAEVSVTNVAPAATIGVDPAAPVAEGGTFTVSLTGPSDPSAADTAAGFEHAFDCGLGDGYGAWGTETSAACTAGDDGTLTVRAKIRDKDGGERAYEAEVSVTNVAPAANPSNDSPTPWGHTVNFTAGADDPSASDAATLAIDWDLDLDGDYDDATGPTAEHSWDAPGEYTVGVRVCDEDGACTTATTVTEVRRHATTLTLGGATSGQYSDPAEVTATLLDTTDNVPIAGATVMLTLGTHSGSESTGDDGVARRTFVIDQAAGSKALTATYDLTELYKAASAASAFEITRERATIAYAGDTFATGTQVRLAATVTEDADGSLGDITRARVTFDVYVGATACGSGTPTRYGPVAVIDTGTEGDGSGTAEVAMPTPGEQTYCIVARLTGTDPATANGYYNALPAQASVLTVVTTTGKFATGGGWIVDPDTGGHGNFGFTARFVKNGSPKGQAVYVWRAEYNGATADFIVKSNAITNITFSDETANGTFPWRATLDGKATLRINRAADGGELYSDGNATFRLVAVDSGASSGRGIDTFAFMVLDKAGATYKVVGTWTSGVYSAGIPLSGGNVVVHLK